jgi:hypothetical protein
MADARRRFGNISFGLPPELQAEADQHDGEHEEGGP